MTDPSQTPGRSLGGRFTEATDPLLERVNRSVDTDRRMWRQDLAGSRAHSAMLAAVGLIDEDERDAIHAGLEEVEAELAQERFVFLPADEDIHMAVERRLGELIGAPARKLHTGRSRNDQVMTDTLLWLRDALGVLRSELVAYLRALLARATEGRAQPMPSFTHLQPAQVSSVGQWLCAHAADNARHLRRLDDLVARLDECPLGSGASAGSYLPLDRQATAAALGFARPAPNATAATGSRADLLDAIGLFSLIGVSLSRLGEELVLFTNPLFGWIHLPDRLTTGSSLLPQKRNPDGAELLRAGGKLAAGEHAALAAACGGLVSGYNKDLQSDKALLFAAYDRTVELVGLAGRHIDAMTWRGERLRAACGPELAALWLADQLVLEGLPFRPAHHLVGQAARVSAETGGSLADGLRAALAADPELAPTVGPDLADRLAAMTPDDLLATLKSGGQRRAAVGGPPGRDAVGPLGGVGLVGR